MKRFMGFVVIIGLCCPVLFGCDNLKNNFSKNGSKPVEAEPQVKGTVIAKVGSIPITLEELDKEVELFNTRIEIEFSNYPQEERDKAKIQGREKKIEYLKNVMVRDRVFYQSALDKGLDRKEEISEAVRKSKMAILAQALEQDLIKDIVVAPADVEKAYTELKDQLKKPELRKVREIVVKSEPEARRMLSDLLVNNTDFSASARSNSIAATKENDGLVKSPKGEDYIAPNDRGKGYEDFVDIAFRLKKGDLSNIFQGPEGYYIIKVEAIKASEQVPLSEIEGKLKEILLVDKRSKALDEFYNTVTDTKIKIDLREGEIK